MQLCVENGVIDLAKGKLLQPNPTMRHSKMAGVSYAANTAASTLMAANSNQLGDDLIRLACARYITAAETGHSQRFAEAKIKAFTGGDIISARPLYVEWVDFRPIGTIFPTTHNRPEMRGSDDGIWRRTAKAMNFWCWPSG